MVAVHGIRLCPVFVRFLYGLVHFLLSRILYEKFNPLEHLWDDLQHTLFYEYPTLLAK